MNATGWNQLFDGNMVNAAFVMYNTAFAGWLVAILFIVYQFMLILKTKNMTLAWVTGLFFAALYASSTILAGSTNPVLKAASLKIIFVILVFELAGILYFWLFK